MKDKIFCILIGFVVGAVVGSLVTYRGCSSVEHTQTVQSDTIRISDTIVVRDTIRLDKPKPYYVEVVRVDTVATIDTITVTVPIEQKTYKNEDYKAVIGGYKPSLIYMDIYRKTTTIRDTVQINNTITKYKPPRWSLSVGPGVGYGPKGFEPYIGVNFGYVIWSK